MPNERQIKVAVEWWANVIANPVFDNNADSIFSVMASELAGRLVRKISDDQIRIFKEELASILKSDSFTLYGMLCVDYEPCRNLREAMDKAKIPASNAPWKSDMYFLNDGTVKAKLGYNGEIEIL